MEIFEFLWMWGLERTESPFPKMDTSKNGLLWWVNDLPNFWGLAVIWIRYIPNDFDSRSKLSKWEHNLWPWFLDIQSWKMLCNVDSSHIYLDSYMINNSFRVPEIIKITLGEAIFFNTNIWLHHQGFESKHCDQNIYCR